MLHVISRYLKRRIYSAVFSPFPKLRSAWWNFRENIYRPLFFGDFVKVELSANCNARCSFCWMFQSDNKPSGLMKLEDFKRFIDLNKKDFIRRRARIQPFFNGEALTHPHFFEIIDYIVNNGIRLARLDTNLGVKKDMKRLMSYPWPAICVNIGGTTKEINEKVMKTKFDIVVENLKQLYQLNKKKVFIKVTPIKTNLHQLREFPKFVKDLGGDPKRIEIGTTGFNTPALAEDKEIEQFFRDVVSPEIEPYLRFTYDINKPRYDIRAKRPGCQFLTDCVTYDGKLTICCQDQFGELNVASAFEVPFYEIRNSERYKKFRQNGIDQKFKMCQECN